MRVFDISDISMILSMPASKVKNWTIGRPLTVKPSVRMGAGKGTSNLYGVGEVHLMGLANRLVDDGLSLEAVKGVIATFSKTGDYPPKDARYLLIFRRLRGIVNDLKRVHLISSEPELAKIIGDQAPLISFYVCDLRKLFDQVEANMRYQETLGVVYPTKKRFRRKRGPLQTR